MTLSLRQKQSIFSKLVGKFLLAIYEAGYEVTLGECYRTPEQAVLNAKNGSGIKNSLHTRRLAIDLMLFKDGVLLALTEQYEPIGVIWESYSTPEYQCCWGGRFAKRDGDHFSIADGGQK